MREVVADHNPAVIEQSAGGEAYNGGRDVDAINVPETALAPRADSAFEAEVGTLVVESLHLEMAPGEIEPEAPLFGEGLGLDSIDALELALSISRTYGLELKSDDEGNHRVFGSLRNLARHIAEHRTK